MPFLLLAYLKETVFKNNYHISTLFLLDVSVKLVCIDGAHHFVLIELMCIATLLHK